MKNLTIYTAIFFLLSIFNLEAQEKSTSSNLLSEFVAEKNNEANYLAPGANIAGYQIVYNETGRKQEEGIWRGNRWEGSYKSYHNNGNLKYDFIYNESGVRDGVQKYYHENGTLKYEGVWKNGEENGLFREYSESGILISEIKFVNGKRE